MSNPLFSWLKSHIFAVTTTLLVVIIGIMILSEGKDIPPVLYANQETTLKVTEGRALLTEGQSRILKAGESAILKVGNTIKTFPRSSATIFWADGSVTRLSEKTAITITSLQVSGDLSSVQIRFETESGKTWSNVTRSLLPDSFFEQTYDNGTYVATVRGTVFEINLDKNYAQAVHHGISIKNTKNNTEVEVAQGKAVQARNWKEIGKEFLDTAWNKWNENEDVIYLDGEMKKLSANLFAYTQQNEGVKSWTTKIRRLVNKQDTVDSLVSASILEKNTDKLDALKQAVADAKTPEQKVLLHARLLAYHQATNILPENESTLALRDTLRDLIIETAPDDEKERLKETFTQVTFNDYVDALSSGSKTQADKLKVKLEKYIEDGVNIPVLKDFTDKAQSILKTEKLQGAFEGVKQNGTRLINEAKDSIMTEDTKNSLEGLKNDAQGLFDDLKQAASK